MGSQILPLLLIGVMISSTFGLFESRHRRSIDLSAAHSLIPDSKLPTEITPSSYILEIRPDFEDSTFNGRVKINVTWLDETNKITLHAHHELQISHSDVKVTQIGLDDTVRVSTPAPPKTLSITRTERHPKKPIYVIQLSEALKRGSQCEVDLSFTGSIWENAEGLFKGLYPSQIDEKRNYVATYFRPHNARRVFPCFDEPAFKVPFTVSIARPKHYVTLFNTILKSSEELNDDSDYIMDHFETTPPMSTFSLGFVTSKLEKLNKTIAMEAELKPMVNIWARPNIHEGLEQVYEKVNTILKSLQAFWGVDFPLCKLDIVALPGFSSVKPADNWGLIVMKEGELLTKGYYLLAQELVYQWLGSWATPYWWSDAHVNKAIAGYLASSTAIEIDNGAEFDGKWPMIVLYSIYYEFSKRYPHSRITGMKQETTCSKTELVLRMLNYTLGPKTFKKGLQQFISDREYKTFFADDIWDSLTKQAHIDGVLCEKVTINDIAGSWITKDRLPVVTVNRHYENKTATVTQKVYLRERPHDVPEQDKMLWWIPLVMVNQDNLDFTNSTPSKWMKKVKEVTLKDLPATDKFIIVNPEEIGPFPVNYDTKNWNMLAAYLQTEEGRNSIPVYTRAKLLHDAWNLAYAGDLSFSTAFDMTLFMKYERNHLVWNPVSTFIDHIGRHIDDMLDVHKKFEKYVRIMLIPLYEELGAVAQPNEESWKENQRNLARTFLCRAGYKPCIEAAQEVYKRWMDQENPDEGNPVPDQYICPVFKWGTQEEWEFGLERVLNFPSFRKQSERTYLLKTLAGCPVQPEKIERMLNLTIIEENKNFTETDIFLIFNMLTGGSSGYTSLFNFLSTNWDIIKVKFESKTNLWDNLIGASTGSFTTQAGYDKVSELFVQHQGEFKTAEYIIEKSLKNIKEETKWSNENLPVIEKWLDDYLKSVNPADDKFIG